MKDVKYIVKINDNLYVAEYGTNVAGIWNVTEDIDDAYDFSNDPEFTVKLAKRLGGKAYKLTRTTTYDFKEMHA